MAVVGIEALGGTKLLVEDKGAYDCGGVKMVLAEDFGDCEVRFGEDVIEIVMHPVGWGICAG